jgi:glutamate dehydrogenase (NAD(P)+)
MDTYSMHARQNTPGVVTGKPLALGGSRGRVEATGRGVSLVALDQMAEAALEPRGARVVIQGFGNVGSIAAQMFAEHGCVIVAISDVTGGYYNPRGIDIGGAIAYAQEHHSLDGYRGGERITNETVLELPCDVLVPAALEKQLTATNAGRVQARLIVEGANGPTTPEADEIFRKRDIFLVPDILANAGGVTVSYFEWVQDLQSFFWSEHEVNQKLQAIMQRAFKEVLATREERKLDMRMAAYVQAVSRVAAARDRGLYP